MFHTPAHKNTGHPAGQVTDPAPAPNREVVTLADYIKSVEATEGAALTPIEALKRLVIAAENFRRAQSRLAVDPGAAEHARSAGILLDASISAGAACVRRFDFTPTSNRRSS